MTVKTIPVLVLMLLFVQSAGVSAQMREHADLAYYQGADADDLKHRLNLVVPSGEGPFPALLWIHGGAWAMGDRRFEMDMARAFAREGVAVAAMSYRLSPAVYLDPPKMDGVSHPAHIEDVAHAFSWLVSHAAEYTLDGERLFVGGFSAGGHLSALLVTDERYLAKHELIISSIRGVIPVSGAYDMVNYRDVIEGAYGGEFAKQHVYGVFGHQEALVDASPTTYLEHLQTPMLVLSDRNMRGYTEVLESRMDELGKQAQFIYMDHLDHVGISRQLAYPGHSPARVQMLKFIRKQIAEVP